jgi:hypothetical protein
MNAGRYFKSGGTQHGKARAVSLKGIGRPVSSVYHLDEQMPNDALAMFEIKY